MRKTLAIGTLAAVLLTSSFAAAQMKPPASPAPDQQQMPGHGGMPCPMQGAMQAQGMHGQGMMGQGMMGGMGTSSDPKAMARMLKLRGDMMKAMGEVMLKHAEAIEKEK